MKYKFIYFDLDDTLLDHKLAEQRALKQVTRSQLQRNSFELTLEQLALDITHYEEVGSFYLKRYRDHWNWVEGADKVYGEISRHHKEGILTNGFAETQREKFRTFGFHKSTDHLVISEEVGYLKPDPRIFEYATSLAGCKPNEILYVGDSYSSDIEGGSAYGWNTAWFTEEVRDTDEKADYIFQDFADLFPLYMN